MNGPVFSIVVPVYKIRDKYLRPCLESISRQSFRDFEAILIDDGSPDDTGDRCDRFAETDDRFRVLHTRNGGVAAARNLGLERVRGQWVWMIDADDWIEENALQVLYDAVSSTDNCDVLQFRMFWNYEDGREVTGRRFCEDRLCVGEIREEREKLLYEIIDPPSFAKSAPGGAHIFFSCDKVFRREYLSEKGLRFIPGIRMSEDMEFYFRCALGGCRLQRIQAPLYHYRRSGENVTARYNPWMAEDRLILFQRMAELVQTAKEELCKPNDAAANTDLDKAMDHMILMAASTVLTQQFYHPEHPRRGRRRAAGRFMRTPAVKQALRRTKLSELRRLNALRLALMRLGAYRTLAFLVRSSHRKNNTV